MAFTIIFRHQHTQLHKLNFLENRQKNDKKQQFSQII